MRKIGIILAVILAIFIVAVYVAVSETDESFRTCELLDIDDVDGTDFSNFDSVTVAANTLYEASPIKEIMQGEQYRDAWAEPVTVPVAFLDTLAGGLRVIEEGGGKQTHSLELEDGKGIRYALRSLSKNPEKLVPGFAETLGLENIIIDGVSAQHPYSALVVARLSDAAGVLHTRSRLMFVPKQATLGSLNDKYGNRLYFFEYESEGKVDWTGMENVKELIDTDDLIEMKMEEGEDITINYASLIRARLFDLIIGDWDRHAKQWGWALRENEGKYVAIPIPTDRDNAFFKQEGVLPTLIASDYALPKVQPFEKEIDYFPGLVAEFDEYFLRSCPSGLFATEAERLKRLLNDRAIETAFLAWPAEIDSLDGREIREKIRARRDSLVPIAARFNDILRERPKREIKLKGCEDLELEGRLASCFECSDQDFGEEKSGNP